MQNRCCINGCFLDNSSNAHAHYLLTLMILHNFISLWAFAVYMENSLWFDRSEICTEVSSTSHEVMSMLIMKLPYTEVKFHPKVKSQTILSSLWVSCKRALRKIMNNHDCRNIYRFSC